MGFSSTSGVLPTSSRRFRATRGLTTGTAGHGRQQDHGRIRTDLGVYAAQGAHVFALDVHVHERREVPILDDLRSQRRESSHQVLEQVPDGVTLGDDLAFAVRLFSQRGRDAHLRHYACSLVPALTSKWSM